MKKAQETSGEKPRYERLQARLESLPWIVNSSVMKIAPQSSNANTMMQLTHRPIIIYLQLQLMKTLNQAGVSGRVPAPSPK